MAAASCLSTPICSVWIQRSNLSQKLRISILEFVNILEIMFASGQNILKDKHPEKWKYGNLFLNHDGEINQLFFYTLTTH